nr:MAG TPA: replicative DNA helicase [Caudoviricetes sp.]
MLSDCWVDQRKKFFNTIYGEHKGYFFICGIKWPGQKFNSGKAFKTSEMGAAERYIQDLSYAGYDVYFTPGLFSRPQRTEDNLIPRNVIWSDVDDGDVAGTHPTVVWSSSTGRKQAVWVLDTQDRIYPDRQGLSRAISKLCSFDMGGWDSTQLLRVPGVMGHKHGEIVGDQLEFGQSVSPGLVAASALRKLGCVGKTTLGRLRQAEATGDRSEALFAILTDLLENGLDRDTIVGLVRHTPWNKWGSDLNRLNKDIDRAEHYVSTHKSSTVEVVIESSSVEEEPQAPVFSIKSLSDFAAIPKPRWLIEGIIEEGSCGFIAAPPKHFKSWVMLDMAVSVASGHRFLGDRRVTKAPTLVVEAEDSFFRLGQRLGLVLDERAPTCHPQGYLTPDLIWNTPSALSMNVAMHPTEGFGERFFEELYDIVQAQGLKLCTFDTLSMLSNGSLSDSQEMYRDVLKPLKAIAQSTGCAMMIVHHTRKAQVGGINSGGAALAGSVALHAWSDNSLYFRREGDNILIDVETKSAAPETLVLSNLTTPGVWSPEVREYQAPEQLITIT